MNEEIYRFEDIAKPKNIVGNPIAICLKDSTYIHKKPQPKSVKDRKCMKCKKEFRSEGIHNRLCITCKQIRGIDV